MDTIAQHTQENSHLSLIIDGVRYGLLFIQFPQVRNFESGAVLNATEIT